MKKVISFMLTVIMMLSFSISAFAYSGHSFNEADFDGMTITYTADGVPIVDDPNATTENIQLMSEITATTINNTWFYSDRRLNNPVFVIPEGKTVLVLQTDSNYGSVQIIYANNTGWVHGSNLQLA